MRVIESISTHLVEVERVGLSLVGVEVVDLVAVEDAALASEVRDGADFGMHRGDKQSIVNYVSPMEVMLSEKVGHPDARDLAGGTVDEFDDPPDEPWRPLGRVPGCGEVHMVFVTGADVRQGTLRRGGGGQKD